MHIPALTTAVPGMVRGLLTERAVHCLERGLGAGLSARKTCDAAQPGKMILMTPASYGMALKSLFVLFHWRTHGCADSTRLPAG